MQKTNRQDKTIEGKEMLESVKMRLLCGFTAVSVALGSLAAVRDGRLTVTMVR